MFFEYNSVKIGDPSASDGTKVIAGEGEGNKTLGVTRKETWNAGEITIYFRVVKDTETALRAFEVTLFDKINGLLRLGKNFYIKYDDGTKFEFNPAPTGVDPTATQQTPQLEKVNSKFNSRTSQTYKFTIAFEPPGHVNGVKINQIKVTRDGFGYMQVVTSGLIPKQFINGEHDALAAFKKYYTSQVEKAVLNTWLGERYFKRVGFEMTSNQGLNGVSDPAGSTWESCVFHCTYKQIAFSEEISTHVSMHLIDPVFKVKQIPEVGYSIKLVAPVAKRDATYSEPRHSPDLEKNTYRKFEVNYFSGIKLDSTYLKGPGNDKVETFVKKKGISHDMGGLPGLYADVVRPQILDILNKMFSIKDVIVYNETVEYTSAPSVAVSMIVISGKDEIVYSERLDTEQANGESFRIIGGTDFARANLLYPKTYDCLLTREIITKSLKETPTRSFDANWFLSKYKNSILGAGGIYSSRKGGVIVFTPIFRVVESYYLTYSDPASSRKTDLVNSEGAKK